MGFTGKFLDFFTNLFIGLHWVALLYAVIAPGLAAGIIGTYITAPLFIPAFLASIGSLSLVTHGVLLILILISSFSPYPQSTPLYRLSVIVALIALKALIYLAVRRNRVRGVSAVLPPLAYFSVLLLVEAVVLLALPGLIPEPVLEELMAILLIALVYTVPIDLVTFSYVKFRDAVKGAEPRMWIPVLVALWTAMPWLTFTVIMLQRLSEPFHVWTSFTPIAMSTGIAITALQILYIALYIHSGGAVTLEAGKNTQTAQTTAPAAHMDKEPA